MLSQSQQVHSSYYPYRDDPGSTANYRQENEVAALAYQLIFGERKKGKNPEQLSQLLELSSESSDFPFTEWEMNKEDTLVYSRLTPMVPQGGSLP